MPLFPYYFRLSSHTDRRYKLFLEEQIVGPQGPAGPGVVNYDTEEVETNVTYVGGQQIFQKTFIVDSGPTPATPLVIDMDLDAPVRIIEMESWLDDGLFQVPIPSADLQVIIVNGNTIVVTTGGDFSGFVGAITLFYFYT
jgi:hypothetical protein